MSRSCREDVVEMNTRALLQRTQHSAYSTVYILQCTLYAGYQCTQYAVYQVGIVLQCKLQRILQAT